MDRFGGSFAKMSNLESLGKLLIFVSVVLFVAGILIYWLGRGLGIVKLPGDIIYKKGNVTIFFPIVSAIALSIFLTVIVNLVLYFLRR
jgi:hypothetical protein